MFGKADAGLQIPQGTDFEEALGNCNQSVIPNHMLKRLQPLHFVDKYHERMDTIFFFKVDEIGPDNVFQILWPTHLFFISVDVEF